MNWNDVCIFRAEHCHRCNNYLQNSKEQTGTERCTLVGGTNSSHAIEIGRCKFEVAEQ